MSLEVYQSATTPRSGSVPHEAPGPGGQSWRSVRSWVPNPAWLGDPMAQFIYTMNRVGKVVPPKREILKDISLSFFPGA